MLSALLASLLLLSSPAVAQQQGSEAHDIFGGLDDTNAPATLAPHRAQAVLNVETNVLGTKIGSREGYALQLPLALSTAPVTGSYSFVDTSGNRQDIVCYDRYCAKSTNQAAFVVFLTSGGRTGSGGAIPSYWTFAQSQGTAYIANSTRDQIQMYDGTTLTSSTSMPKGTQVEMAGSRLSIADVVASPNSVYYSQSGVYTNFATGVNSVDPYIDNIGSPGDRTTALRYDRGKLWVWKNNSINACVLGDQYTSQCRIISPDIGTSDPLSIVTTPQGMHFRDQNRNFWRLDDNGLTPISLNIKTLVASQASGTSQSNTQTTQADWQAGVQTPLLSWNTVTNSGSIFPSSVTFVDTSSNDFSAGTLVNVSTTDFPGSVVLSSNVVEDAWGNSLVAGRLAWTTTAGSFGITANTIYGNTGGNPGPVTDLYDSINTSSVTLSSGSWTFSWSHTSDFGDPQLCSATRNNSGGSTSGTCFSFRFMENAGGDYYELKMGDGPSVNSPNSLVIAKNLAGVSTTLASTSYSFAKSTQYTFQIVKSTDGRIWNYLGGVMISSTAVADVSITSSTKLRLLTSEYTATGLNNHQNFGNFRSYQYQSAGTFTSQIFDTVFSTPTWGAFNSTFTANNAASEGNIAFYVQSSTANNGGGFTSLYSTSDTLRPSALAQNRYVRYQASFTTLVSTKSPSLDAASLVAATTGQFVTQCIQPNSNISSFGALACTETKSGAASLVYYATSAASCATLPSTPPLNWQTSVTNNANLSISTNTALYIAWRSLLTSATEQAQVDACTLYWNNGAVSPPVWGAFDSGRNAIFWTATVGTSTTNNRILKYDLNRFEWFLFDIAANALRYINSQIYFGSPTSGNWYLYGNGVKTDNGSSFTSYWQSKDFSGNQPFNEKLWQAISWVGRNQGVGALTTTWSLGNGKTGNYSVSLSTDATKAYVRSNVSLPMSSKTTFMNIKFGNNAAGQPWEINGFKLDYILDPWRVLTP